MADLKARRTGKSVGRFLAGIRDERVRADCRTLARLMARATRSSARMRGPSIVGFGGYHYKYPSGREGDWFQVGFSPRQQALTVYIMAGFAGQSALMKKLGRHKTGKSGLCR